MTANLLTIRKVDGLLLRMRRRLLSSLNDYGLSMRVGRLSRDAHELKLAVRSDLRLQGQLLQLISKHLRYKLDMLLLAGSGRLLLNHLRYLHHLRQEGRTFMHSRSPILHLRLGHTA